MFAYILFIACQPVSHPSAEKEPTFDVVSELESQLTGRFDSEDQAMVDSNFYAISLEMCTIAVPSGERALYVEQAAIGSTPYRQRIYILTEEEGRENTVRSTIYSLKSEDEFIGYCNGDAVWMLDAEDYELRAGCDVVMEWNGLGFSGSTQGEGCSSALGGANYATSIVDTTPDRIESWDQGWFADGNQAWGAVDGPYVFIRRD